MALLIRVKDVDWSGKGFPIVGGFVASANLVTAFDFRPRPNRLKDASGKGFEAVPYRNPLTPSGALVVDPTVLQDTANGLGIIVRNGALNYGVPNPAYPVGGAAAFTLMIVGGYSGIPFDANQPVQNATISNLADLGNGVTSAETPPMVQQYVTNGTLGGRVKSGATSNIGEAAAAGKKSCLFLSYDGLKFTYTNKTTGTVTVKTNADLNILGATLAPDVKCPMLVSGNYYVAGSPSAVAGLYPELYQLAKWNKVLSDSEMQAQYASSKALFAPVGI